LNAQSITNKAEAVNETIADHSLDVLALTETWHSACDDVRLRLTTPADYAVTAAARSTGRGGGVAILPSPYEMFPNVAAGVSYFRTYLCATNNQWRTDFTT